jgi:hypothetical protein
MVNKYLEPYDGEIIDGKDGEGRSVLLVFAAPPVPALIGHANNGITWLCPACDTEIALNVYPRQLVDITFCCPSCMKISYTPGREAGQPPAGRPVVLGPKQYGITSSVDLGNVPVMWMSQRALQGHISESGARTHMPDGEIRQSTILNAASLLRLAEEAAQLLGKKYSALQESDKRGQASPTPPPMRHRLIELIEYARKAASLVGTDLSSADSELDYRQLTELKATTMLFRRWRHHPAWPQLMTSLTNNTETQHSVMLLTVAGFLTDTGNPVGIVFRQGSGKIPDMWIEPSLGQRLNIEIKTPVEFRAPEERPTVDSMYETIARLVNKCASSRHGQLAPEHSGVLIIGAFHLGQNALDELCSAGQSVLNRQKNRKHHLAGLIFSELSYMVTDAADASGQLQRHFMPSLQTRLVHHPGYTGQLIVREGKLPWDDWSTPPTGS